MWKILIVDDDPLNRKLLEEILKERAETRSVASGTEAVIVFSELYSTGSPFDLILLDIAMPDMNGIDVLKKIRALEEKEGVRFGHGIPVIMVTAYKEPFMESFRGGADDYILKPFDGEALWGKIQAKLSVPRRGGKVKN